MVDATHRRTDVTSTFEKRTPYLEMTRFTVPREQTWDLSCLPSGREGLLLDDIIQRLWHLQSGVHSLGGPRACSQ